MTQDTERTGPSTASAFDDAAVSQDAAVETAAEAPADAANATYAEGTVADAATAGAAEAFMKWNELTAELDEAKQQLLRVHADFDNFRRRTRQEKEDLQQFATRKLMTDLLPVVDNFDRALTAAAGGDGQTELYAGLEMVHRQLTNVLQAHGVTPMDCHGAQFDPNLHEAVMQEPAGDAEPGIIVAELQKGYLLAGRVLRPAMVKVTV